MFFPKLLIITFLVYGSIVSADEIVCITVGRFRARDPSCRSYFLCVKSKGAFVARNYFCPGSAIFNPSTNRCSVDAVCVDEICNTLPLSVTKITDPNSKDCRTYIECVGPVGNRYPVIKKCDQGYFNKDLLPEPGCWCEPKC